tara:strand:+ start:284 stop:1216 length:933 start_codon:yes stop_codon:yes gene_type:complete
MYNLNSKLYKLKSQFVPRKCSEYDNMSLHEFIKQYSHRFKGTRGTAWTGEYLKRSVSKLDLFCAFNDLGNKPIDKITTLDIDDFIEFLGEELGYSNSTKNKYLTVISPCLKYALAAEKIAKLPAINWTKVEDEGKPRYFNSDEIVQIKKAFQECHWSDWMPDIFTVAINTGMRRGELSKIGSKVNLVEIDGANFLSIPKEESKTKKARLVPLNEDALAAVKRLGDVSKFWRNKSWNKAWIYARNKVSPGDKNFTGHVTRHTTATMFADAGMNLKHIGKFLGHASERTTMKYIKTSNEQLVKMSSLLQGVA